MTIIPAHPGSRAVIAGFVLALLGAVVLMVDVQFDLHDAVWTAATGDGRAMAEARGLLTRNVAVTVFIFCLVLGVGAVAAWQMAALARSHRRISDLAATLERARDEAEAANLGKSAVLANISHEIRTPMNGVIGLLSLVVGGPLPRQEKEYAALALRSAENLLALINDILDFSKLEAGRVRIEVEDYDLGRTVADVLTLLAPKASEANNILQADIAADAVLALRGDRLRLRQIMFNLLGNAIKFTRDGAITLRVRTETLADGGIMLHGAVEDTGVGIAEEDLGSLFQRFTQVDQSSDRRFGGTGLGLAICRELCERMGGGIGVTSVRGVGSVFSFHVRCGAAMGTPPDLLDADPQAAPTLPPLRILVVDDVEVNSLVLGEMLRRNGHDVAFAPNGQDAVDAVRALGSERPFDLVLMDVHMPVMDGYAASRAIRGLPPPHGRTLIVAVTANAGSAENDRCIEAGMDGVLSKPINRKDLFALLGRVAGDAAREAPGAAAGGPAAVEASEPPLLDAEQIAGLLECLDPESWIEAVDQFEISVLAMVEDLGGAADGGIEQRRLAHAVKGVSLNMGAAALAALALEVEKATPEERGLALHRMAEVFTGTMAALRAAASPIAREA